MGVELSPIDAAPRALGFLAYDVFQYFSWWIYLVAALAYSALVFTGELSKDGPLIFSRKNARSTQVIIGIHINFLIVLLLLIRLVCSIDPLFPSWMTRNIGRGNTLLEVFFILGMVAISFFERRFLYVESNSIAPDSDRTS
jgi:hypothetical protein